MAMSDLPHGKRLVSVSRRPSGAEARQNRQMGRSVSHLLPLCAIQLAVLLVVTAAAQTESPRAGMFSDFAPGGTPPGWEPLRFPNVDAETEYSLVDRDGRVVLRAESRGAASALITRVSVDSSRFRYLHWSWNTGGDCFSGSWRRPEADDFPLRLFVIFERSGGFMFFFRRLASGFPGDAVLYAADATPSADGERSSHLNGRIKVVPLRRPESAGGAWSRHVRDVRADYIDLYGRAPRDVATLAVMTDTDNSRSECVSHFGDIYFSEERS